MTTKALKDMEYGEIVDLVAERAMSSLVKGTPWNTMMSDVTMLVLQWNSEKREAASSLSSASITANSGASANG